MRLTLAAAASAALVSALATQARAQEPAAMKIAAPELEGIEAWINTKPLALKDLRGKVIVLHFWTFG